MDDLVLHRASSIGEIRSHGDHLDILEPQSYGSYQRRVDPITGRLIDQQLNFNNDLGGGHLPLNASGMPITGHNY